MSTDLNETLDELGREILATLTKLGLGLYTAWTEREKTAENPSTATPPHHYPAPAPPQRPVGRQPENPGSFLPRHFKTDNDNSVRRTRGYSPIGECHGDGVITVDKAFVGDHSLTHTLRFAAWLVKVADQSDDHEDFFKVLSAVEDDEG